MELSASDCVIVCVFKLDEGDSRRQEGSLCGEAEGLIWYVRAEGGWGGGGGGAMKFVFVCL